MKNKKKCGKKITLAEALNEVKGHDHRSKKVKRTKREKYISYKIRLVPRETFKGKSI